MNMYDTTNIVREARKNIEEGRKEFERLVSFNPSEYLVDVNRIILDSITNQKSLVKAASFDYSSLNDLINLKLNYIDLSSTIRKSLRELNLQISNMPSFNNLNFSAITDFQSVLVRNNLTDFRMSVLINEASDQLEEYDDNSISYEEFNNLKSRVFQLESKLELVEEKNKKMSNKLEVHVLLGWLGTVLSVYGYNMDFESIKDIINTFVEVLKHIIEQQE